MKFLWRCFQFFLLLLVLLGLSVIAGASWLLSGQRYQHLLSEQLSDLFGAHVQVGTSHLSLHNGLGVRFEGVTIQDDADAAPFFTAAEVDLLLDFSALWRGDLLFRRIYFVKPYFQILANGKRFLQLADRLRSADPTPRESSSWLPRLTQGFSPTLAVQEVRLQEAKMSLDSRFTRSTILLTEAEASLSFVEKDRPLITLQANLKSKGGMVGRFSVRASATKEVNFEQIGQDEWAGEFSVAEGQLQPLGRVLGEEWPTANFSLRSRFQGKGEGPVELFGVLTASDLQVGEVLLQEAQVSLTKVRWAGWDLGVARRAFTLEAQIEQAQGKIGKEATPITIAGGELKLQDENLVVAKLHGDYGKASQFSDASISLKKLSAKTGPILDAAITADVDLGDEVFRLLTALTPINVASFSQIVVPPQGRALTHFHVQRAGSRGKLAYDGVLTLQQASIQVLPWRLNLDEVSGSLQLDTDAVTTNDLTFKVGQSSITAQGTVKDYLSPRRSAELQLAFSDVRDYDIAPFLPSGRMLPQGGSLAGRLKVAFTPDEETPRVDGQLSFSHVHFDLVDFLQPFEVSEGELMLAGQGGIFSVKRGQLPGGGFSGQGRIESWTPLRLELSGNFPELNLEAALALDKPEDGSPRKTDREVRADLTSTRLRYKGTRVENLHLFCYWHGRQADLLGDRATVAGGGVAGEAILWPDFDAMYLGLQLSEVDVERFFQAVGSPTKALTGRLSSQGKIYIPDWAKWDELAEWEATLSVAVMHGVAQRLPILVRLWSALSMQGLLQFQLPSLPTEGLPFSSLTGDFALGKGRALTRNLTLDASFLRLDSRGHIDLASRALDLRLALVPLHGITSSVAKVPLAGALLARSADYLTTLNFQVSGPYADPSVTPVLVDMSGQ